MHLRGSEEAWRRGFRGLSEAARDKNMGVHSKPHPGRDL